MCNSRMCSAETNRFEALLSWRMKLLLLTPGLAHCEQEESGNVTEAGDDQSPSVQPKEGLSPPDSPFEVSREDLVNYKVPVMIMAGRFFLVFLSAATSSLIMNETEEQKLLWRDEGQKDQKPH